MRLWAERGTWVGRRARARLAALDPGQVHSIAVIKHAALGDLLLTRPFLLALREHFPRARLTFSAISHYLRGVPEDLVDRVHVTPSSKERPGALKTLAAYRALGAHDLLFDLTNSTRSLTLARLTPARFKVGFQYRWLHKMIFDVAIPRAAYRFEAETYLEQLHPFGFDYSLPLRFGLDVQPPARPRPYLVYFPTASNTEKSWPPAHFSQLLQTLAVQLPDHDHLLLAGIADWEQRVADEIMAPVAGSANVVRVAAGPDDAALIRGARLLVSNDTGIRHLGIALERPTVGIFFATPPWGYAPRWGSHRVVFGADGRPPAVQAVAQAVLAALAETATPGTAAPGTTADGLHVSQA